MILLIILFCPLIFSESISYYDYKKEGSSSFVFECYYEQFGAANCSKLGYISEITPLSEERATIAKTELQKCVSKIALKFDKIAETEDILIEKLHDSFKLINIDYIECKNILEQKANSSECYKFRNSEYICDQWWGDDGCMVKIYNEHCGAEFTNKMRDWSQFWCDKRQNREVSRYLPKVEVKLERWSFYDDEDNLEHGPSVCSSRAYQSLPPMDPWDPKPLTGRELNMARRIIKKCFSEIALVNPKVQKVEHALAEKLYDSLKFYKVDMAKCLNVFRAKLEDNKCYNSIADKQEGFSCDKLWGRDGCMIEIYDEYCGEGMAKKLVEMELSKGGSQQQCFDRYFNKKIN